MDFLSSVFPISMIASIMIVAILLLRRYVKVRIYNITWLWLLVLTRLLLPVTIESPITVSDMVDKLDGMSIDTAERPIETHQEGIENTEVVLHNNQESQQPIDMNPSEHTIDLGQLLEVPQRMSRTPSTLLVWMMGAVGVMLYLLAHLWQFNYRIRACGYQESDKYLDDIYIEVKSKINLKKKVTILQSAYTDVPVVYGWLRPCIVLPPKLRQSVGVGKMSLILTHELMHIKRHDTLLNYLWLIARALHWYNPLVWIAYSRYQADVELACDDMVMRHLNKNQCYMYSQSLLDVLKLSKGYALPSIPVALGKDKKNIKKRVINILNNAKRLKYSTLIIVAMMLVSIVVGFTTACMPKSSSTDIDTSDIYTPASENTVLSCPDIYMDTIVSVDGKVDIVIDAKVYAPDVDKFPIIKVEPTPIKQDTLEMLVDTLMEGELGHYANGVWTKADIEAKIQRFEEKLENEEFIKAEYERYLDLEIERSYDDIKSSIRNSIAKYTQKLDDVPEKRDKVPASYNYYLDYFYGVDNDFYNMELSKTQNELDKRADERINNVYLIADNQISTGDYMRMFVFRENGIESYDMIYYTVKVVRAKNDYFQKMRAFYGHDLIGTVSEGIEPFDAPYPVLNISLEKAVDMAQDLMVDMGINNFYLTKSYIRTANPPYDGIREPTDWKNTDDKFYVLTFKPLYKDIPLILANNQWGEEGQWGLNYGFESIQVTVSNDEVVEFSWINPIDTSNIINDDVKLMDFDTIIESATNYMQQQYTLSRVAPSYQNSGEDLVQFISTDIKITEIKLGLSGVFDPNDAGGYMLVPTWSFYGSIGKQKDGSGISGGEEVQRYMPFLSVNAVDGSIIRQYASYE